MDEAAGQSRFLVDIAGRPWTALDPVFHLAKVEVAGSNPVIRSRKPRFGGVRSSQTSTSAITLRESPASLVAIGKGHVGLEHTQLFAPPLPP